MSESDTSGDISMHGRIETLDGGPGDQPAWARAMDYRGDVTLHRIDGGSQTGYLSNIRETADGRTLDLFPPDGGPPISVNGSEIAAIAFTGRDMAEGRSWEAWQAKKRAEAEAIVRAASEAPVPSKAQD